MARKPWARCVRLDHQTRHERTRYEGSKKRKSAPENRNARSTAPARVKEDGFFRHPAQSGLALPAIQIRTAPLQAGQPSVIRHPAPNNGGRQAFSWRYANASVNGKISSHSAA